MPKTYHVTIISNDYTGNANNINYKVNVADIAGSWSTTHNIYHLHDPTVPFNPPDPINLTFTIENFYGRPDQCQIVLVGDVGNNDSWLIREVIFERTDDDDLHDIVTFRNIYNYWLTNESRNLLMMLSPYWSSITP